jgi:hypothetical protein
MGLASAISPAAAKTLKELTRSDRSNNFFIIYTLLVG